MKADSMLMKELNKKQIRIHLKRIKKATKPELALLTGLSVVTVNSLISEMLENGEVLEGDTVPSNGGRPCVQYKFNPDRQYGVVIYGYVENGYNHFHFLVVNLYGEVICSREEDYRKVTLQCFESMINNLFNVYDNIGVIGFGLPGEIDKEKVTIMDYPALIGTQLLKYYEEKYCIPVVFENDINAATEGYYQKLSALKDVNSVVGIYFPRIYLPGAGIVLNGELYYGENHMAGELGVLPMPYKWEELDYNNSDMTAEMIGTLIITINCILAPSTYILYGDFLNAETKEKIEVLLKSKGSFKIQLCTSTSIDEDYKRGMIKIVLQKLEKEKR